jgi:hypothetical protein
MTPEVGERYKNYDTFRKTHWKNLLIRTGHAAFLDDERTNSVQNINLNLGSA